MIKTIPIDYDFDWGYSVTLDQMRRDIEALEVLGATHVEIRAENSYDCAVLEIQAVCEREETPEEEARRLAMDTARKEAKERAEIETLKQLKAKYPNA